MTALYIASIITLAVIGTAVWIAVDYAIRHFRRPHDLHETEDFSDSDCRPASLIGTPIDAFRDRGA